MSGLFVFVMPDIPFFIVITVSCEKASAMAALSSPILRNVTLSKLYAVSWLE